VVANVAQPERFEFDCPLVTIERCRIITTRFCRFAFKQRRP
jgi:hypothetical protein